MSFHEQPKMLVLHTRAPINANYNVGRVDYSQYDSPAKGRFVSARVKRLVAKRETPVIYFTRQAG